MFYTTHTVYIYFFIIGLDQDPCHVTADEILKCFLRYVQRYTTCDMI